MPTTTSRLSLAQPVGTDPPSEIRTADTANMAVLDNTVTVQRYTLIGLPAANSVPNDTLAYVTDQSPPYYVISNGSSWLPLVVGGAGSRGAVNIATTGTRTNPAYGALNDAADQVTGIVLPTNGLIAVWYHATWQESVLDTANAAIFLGANQLQVASPAAAPGGQSAKIDGSIANRNVNLFSSGGGLLSAYRPTNAYTGDVSTGQIVGYETVASATVNDAGGSGSFTPIPSGPCYIFAAAGTYTLAVMFRSSSGSVTASNRKLWVEAKSFA